MIKEIPVSPSDKTEATLTDTEAPQPHTRNLDKDKNDTQVTSTLNCWCAKHATPSRLQVTGDKTLPAKLFSITRLKINK